MSPKPGTTATTDNTGRCYPRHLVAKRGMVLSSHSSIPTTGRQNAKNNIYALLGGRTSIINVGLCLSAHVSVRVSSSAAHERKK